MSVDAAKELAETANTADLNEADTRFQILDKLLIEVLGWPRSAFDLERSSADGFSDYVLKKPNGVAALIIEAKRTGNYFQLPENFNAGKKLRQVKVKSLLSGSLKDALLQAQRYAAELGCEFAAVSNGVQFVYFKVFERGRAWKDLGAIVISDISWFEINYPDAVTMFGYSSVVERASLTAAFRGSSPDGREVFYPKEKINAFSQILNHNILAATLRPLAKKYFGPIVEQDPDFIEACYVNQRAYDLSLRGVRTLIKDAVTPFFESYGVSEIEDSDRGSAIHRKIQKNTVSKAGSDVVVLFGGKGSGKSTFLWRVLHHKPPQFIKKHVAVATVNMLQVEKDEASIKEAIWRGIAERLDTANILSGDRDQLTQLFQDRWEVAAKQELFGLDSDSTAYNQAANALLAAWKIDLRYVARRLALWHQRMHRGIVVVLDNTDQLENQLQDYAFTVAQSVSAELGCLVLIAMREERFYASKIRGLLDAYQNSAFHISSPSSTEVFIRRLEYLLRELRTGEIDIEESRKEQLLLFLQAFLNDFRRIPDSPLNKFISACAHGNIRLALDLFVELLLSGYTNAKEMTELGVVWTIQIHQVVRPLMSPTRLFYDEKLSKVLNIYQVRSGTTSSHFTGLRILRLLSDGQDPTIPGFVAFGELKNQFMSRYGNEDDFKAWMDVLLSSNVVEASTRQDFYTDQIDSLRITAFGQFISNELLAFFTYIELAATDCGIRDEATCNGLVLLTNQEVQLMSERKKYERVQRRLEKAELFLNYLGTEEERELEYFGTPDEPRFIPNVRAAFLKEKEQVLRSARKNR
ncbi:hypothetical protein [Lysobacter terrae]